jgi:hypothetical protein
MCVYLLYTFALYVCIIYKCCMHELYKHCHVQRVCAYMRPGKVCLTVLLIQIIIIHIHQCIKNETRRPSDTCAGEWVSS